MYLDYTAEQHALRTQLRDYFAALMTPELQEESETSEGGGPHYRVALRKMGTDGWLGIGWPKEYGGQGRSVIEQFIFSDEVQRAGFPLPFLTINSVGPTIMRYGSDLPANQILASRVGTTADSRCDCPASNSVSRPEARKRLVLPLPSGPKIR